MQLFVNWFRFRINLDRDYFAAGCYVVVVLAFMLGLYIRLKGLGKSPFTIDEYLIATSVRNILEHGLPQFDCGGYYVRGLLLQYLAVPFFKYGSNDELSFRLITVFFNLLTVPALYLLAKQLSGRTVGCLVVTLFCFSIWETEMARFARMYAPFQAMFVWYVYFLYNAIVQSDSVSRKWIYVISLVSIFIYEGAIFLALLNFLPLVLNRKQTNAWHYVASIFIVVVAYGFISYNFRFFGIENHLPPDIPSRPVGEVLPIEIPALLITTLTSNSTWMLIFLIPLGLSGIAIWHLFADRRLAQIQSAALTTPQAILFSLFIILSLLNLYGLLIHLVLLVVILALLFNWLSLGQIRLRSLALMSIAIGSTFIFWSCYGIFTDGWYALLDTERTSLIERLLIVLFKYPATYSKILFLWFQAMPVLTSATALLILFGFLEAAFKDYEGKHGYLLLLLILLGLAVLLATLKQSYHTIRYTFFMYPVVLLVASVSLIRLAQLITANTKAYRISLTALVLAFVIFAEDFGIDHFLNIDSDRVLYRIGYDRAKEVQYYPRYDFRTPARVVNENLRAGEIVVSTTNGAPYYLRQLDYFYRNYNTKEFGGISGCRGKKDVWSNANLIYRPDELFDLLENSNSTIWLIVRPERQEIHQPELKEIEDVFDRYRVFQSVDVSLYRIPPKKDRNNQGHI